MTRKTPDTILDEATQILERLQEETRHAREARKDLRACMKEFEDLIMHRSEEMFHRELETGARLVYQEMNKAVDQASAAAIVRFEEIGQEIFNGMRMYQAAVQLVEEFKDDRLSYEEVRDKLSIVTDLIKNHETYMTFTAARAAHVRNTTEVRVTQRGKLVDTRFPDRVS